MNIRKHRESDRERILELLRLNTPEYFSPDEEEDLIYYLDNHADNYYVLEISNIIVGCGGFNLSEDGETGRISWDIFDTKYQGKGYGSILTKFRIERMKEIDTIKTISVRTSQLVYPFYEKFGLKIREIVKDYWAEGFDLYRLDSNIDLI